MSNETRRDVFEGLLESYMYSADMVIDEISTDGVADRLSLGNIIASTRDRYDNALPDETDKQKNCPYCHENDPQSKHAHYGKAMSDKTEYFDFVRKTKLYRRVKARIKSPEDQHPKLCVTQMNRFREVSVVLDKAINYCPICGRKL